METKWVSNMARQRILTHPRRPGRRIDNRDRGIRVPLCGGHVSSWMAVGGRGAPLAIANTIAPISCVTAHHRGENTGDGTSPGERAQIAATSAVKHVPV